MTPSQVSLLSSTAFPTRRRFHQACILAGSLALFFWKEALNRGLNVSGVPKRFSGWDISLKEAFRVTTERKIQFLRSCDCYGITTMSIGTKILIMSNKADTLAPPGCDGRHPTALCVAHEQDCGMLEFRGRAKAHFISEQTAPLRTLNVLRSEKDIGVFIEIHSSKGQPDICL